MPESTAHESIFQLPEWKRLHGALGAWPETLADLRSPLNARLIRMEELAEPYIRRRAQRHLERGRVVIFGGGTGNPYFSTDTAAVLRGLEIEADVIIKATAVDGIYSEDPKINPAAEFLAELSFQDAIVRGIQVMDANAFGLCKENRLPIVVMNINQPGAVAKVVLGERVGTLVK